MGDRTSRRAGSARSGRSRRRPTSNPKATCRAPRPKPRASFALRLHPPRWAGVRARRNLTKQPTSRLCSADESVVTSRRCQRPATRSFHGLCLLSKVLLLPHQPGDANPARARFPSRSPLFVRSWPLPRDGKPSELVTSWDPSVGSPRPSAAKAVVGSSGEGGRSRVPLRRLFSAGARAPHRAPSSHTQPRLCGLIEAVRPESVRKSQS
jgi:hypothetical protein